ncbi:hypothetical protein KDH_59250 [Dictyobacter sp. S3.2.2.5]|uniref:Uncharacterized protein n=1 Tax=Dictyobacter halimunensis TaxID=3026934 RepID=A0ABQ6G2S6_9CHLR|nr:hypothetical protein KDH_59250 [Dictyobacter sp. S3.2.2.5]
MRHNAQQSIELVRQVRASLLSAQQSIECWCDEGIPMRHNAQQSIELVRQVRACAHLSHQLKKPGGRAAAAR